ncbi:MAG: phosphate ABC transporter substrate-binding protein [Ignavibacteriaceae bacterium]|nr:phosphate ABC transporter substrate-binding protein [Ignavibacteriaceae bacterium]
MKLILRKNLLKQIDVFAFILFFLISINISCFYLSNNTNVIKIKGSDTMLKLTTMLATEYMKFNPGTSIYVEGGGTKTGIEALSEGLVDICTASRLLKPEEIKVLANSFGSIGISTLVAKDALSIYINKDSQVKNLSLESVRKIFSGKIKNWKEVGGDNAEIRVLSRSPNSGTYLYFKEHVLLNENYFDNAEIKASTAEIVEIVSKDKYAIGYGGVGYGENVHHSSINNIYPTAENVRNESYPISRYLFFITRNIPTGLSKKFIDWVLAQEGQQVVKKAGFISLWERQ